VHLRELDWSMLASSCCLGFSITVEVVKTTVLIERWVPCLEDRPLMMMYTFFDRHPGLGTGYVLIRRGLLLAGCVGVHDFLDWRLLAASRI
jgi:hypothetical protein